MRKTVSILIITFVSGVAFHHFFIDHSEHDKKQAYDNGFKHGACTMLDGINNVPYKTCVDEFDDTKTTTAQ